jgi:hypothetical protein
MPEKPIVNPHQPAWFWIGTGWLALAGVVVGGYSNRATRFDPVAAAMWVAYLLGALSVVCFVAAIRGWIFPGAKAAVVPPASEPPLFALQPLVLTIRDHGTYMDRHDPLPGGRPLADLHVAMHVANPNPVAVMLSRTRLEQVVCQLAGAIQIKGMPRQPDPLGAALPQSLDSTPHMEEGADDFTFPPLVGPRTTVPIETTFYLPLGEADQPYTVPLRVEGTLVVVDTFKNESRSERVKFR